MSLGRNNHSRYRSHLSPFHLPDKPNVMNGTSFSFQARGSLLEQNPEGGSSLAMRKTFTNSVRNTHSKLDSLRSELDQLHEQAVQTTNSTKNIALHLQFLKEDSLSNKLPQTEARLRAQIKTLRKQLDIVGRSSALRYEGIWQSVSYLSKDVKEIASSLVELGDKIGKMEGSLGYYSAAQKHKY